jgi:hypothetical protein
VEQFRYNEKANRFIAAEAHFNNDFLLQKKIDAKNKTITLVFGGMQISISQINELKNKLKYYNLTNTELEIKQGFSFLNDDNNQLNILLNTNKKEQDSLLSKLDSVKHKNRLSNQIFKELQIQYPQLKSAVFNPVTINQDSTAKSTYLVLLNFETQLKKDEKEKIERWLKLRLNKQNILFTYKYGE